MRSNPFFELYVGDRISSEEFITVFSPFLIDHALPLFAPGNVVVTGIQGSGKSMLLSLMKPGVRLQYQEAGRDFPVPKRYRRFIGAGINLTHSNAIDFGYRKISDDPKEVSIFFGDFVNYSLAIDLLKTVEVLGAAGSKVSGEIGIKYDDRSQRELTKIIRADPSWFGYLANCENVRDVIERFSRRINAYRSFLNMNEKVLSGEIRDSKTSIGVPISALAEALKTAGILQRDVNIFLHVDQYEELANLGTAESGGADYRAVINRALARRDPSVSYRIGSRGHAWHEHGLVFGSTAKLEEERDYKFVDLDDKLRRHENRKTWIFPEFAADVFARRLYHAGLNIPNNGGRELLRKVFGTGLSPEEKARKYAGRSRHRAIKLEADWPEALKDFLLRLAEDDPLSARLGEAWFLQKGTKGLPAELAAVSVPWNGEYWRKERIEVALIQIASRCGARPYWSGEIDVVDLSGGNILTFLSICQFIWDAQVQVGRQPPQRQPALVEIEPEVQAIGIFKASDYWLKKISQETGHSGDRLRFVRYLGELLARYLNTDRKLSYPGRNGFSVAENELEERPALRSFLYELSDYGNLLQYSHTTKEKDRRTRTKWYPNPILCPHFKLHYKRLKEPMYVRATDVEAWLLGAKGQLPKAASDDDLPLFQLNRD